MNGRYFGRLPTSDPLHGYLRHTIFPQLWGVPHDPDFQVYQSVYSRNVYLYAEMRSGARVVGKFNPQPHDGATDQANKGQTEYNNLVFLRSIGFNESPHYVVRPLGFNPDINGLLVMEYLEGRSLATIINQAIHQGDVHCLYRKLGALAHFLATMHNRTAKDWGVVFTDAWAYSRRLVKSLVVKRGMRLEFAGELHALRDAWRDCGCMWEDRAALVHGDVTPSNFLFGGGSHVMAIDLERMQWADRVFDLGRLCGELKHFFCQGTGDIAEAEPFIGHFLWEYCCHLPDRMGAFEAITRRAPFYIGITLLRIARNSWISQDYRWQLLHEARQTLRALP